MPVFSIAPVRLTIAVICAVLALILLLWALIRRAVKRARFGRHTSGGTSVYNAGYKGRGGWAAGRRSRSAVPRHHRPSVGRRRYGRGGYNRDRKPGYGNRPQGGYNNNRGPRPAAGGSAPKEGGKA